MLWNIKVGLCFIKVYIVTMLPLAVAGDVPGVEQA